VNTQFQPSFVVEMQIMSNNCPQNRYKKQRGYNPNSNCVVIKFLPIPLAVIMATIILKVKPIEAEFALKEHGTEAMSTNSVLYTAYGRPIDPTKMAAILGETFQEFGLSINIQDLRHALEAFAHKFSPEGSSSNPIYAQLAHHAPGTSFRYGRDQDCFVGIPADVSIANSSACNNWNSFILDSPSLMSRASRPKIIQQLQSLELIGPLNDLAEGDYQSLNNDFGTLSVQRAISSTIEQSQSIQVHVSNTSAANGCSHDADGAFAADHTSQLSSSDMSESGPHTVVSCTSPPTMMKKRVRNEQEIQERKLLAQKKLKLVEGMRPKQKQALQFLERSSSSAFILLPTGSGKTHLIWTHKREQECAVIFVPYRILGSQLQCVLESHGLTVTWPFQSYSGSIDAMLCNVHFAILPYETAPEAVGLITSLNKIGRLGPIWVDEVYVL